MWDFLLETIGWLDRLVHFENSYIHCQHAKLVLFIVGIYVSGVSHKQEQEVEGVGEEEVAVGVDEEAASVAEVVQGLAGGVLQEVGVVVGSGAEEDHALIICFPTKSLFAIKP